MKFEKFLKGCGTHGEVIERENGEKMARLWWRRYGYS